MCKKFTPFQITVMVIFIFLSTYCFAQTRYDVDNPPPYDQRLPIIGESVAAVKNINHADAVHFQDLKKAVCYVYFVAFDTHKELTGFLMNTVENSFDRVHKEIYLMLDNNSTLPLEYEVDQVFISFDYEVANPESKTNDDINNRNENNSIRSIWEVKLTQKFETYLSDYNNEESGLFSLYEIDTYGEHGFEIEKSEVFQNVYALGWTLHPKYDPEKWTVIGHPRGDLKKFVKGLDHFRIVDNYANNDETRFPNFKHLLFAENSNLSNLIGNEYTNGFPLFDDHYVFGMTSIVGQSYDRNEIFGGVFENVWKKYAEGYNYPGDPLGDWLDPNQTWISKVEGGYLKDLIKNKPVDFDLEVTTEPRQSDPFEIRTKDFFPISNIGAYREAYLGHGILGKPEEPNALGTYLTLHPDEDDFRDLLLYGASYQDEGPVFKADSWYVNDGVPGVIDPISNTYNYPNVPSTDIRNLILQYVRVKSNNDNQVVNLVRQGREDLKIPVIAKIKTDNQNTPTKVRAVKFPNQMPYNAVELFDKSKFHKKMWQSYKYAENRGENSTNLHIKSLYVNSLGSSKTIKTGDNGGYLNLVNTNYKIGPIKTSVKRKDKADPNKYVDINPNFVTITMEIHNPNEREVKYGAWIDYFNRGDLNGINYDTDTYNFIDDGTIITNEDGSSIFQPILHYIEDVKNPYRFDHPNVDDANNFEEIENTTQRITFKFKMPSAEEIKLTKKEKLRTTRLRIGIYHNNTPDIHTSPSPISIFDEGEVEDYMIKVRTPAAADISAGVKRKAKLFVGTDQEGSSNKTKKPFSSSNPGTNDQNSSSNSGSGSTITEANQIMNHRHAPLGDITEPTFLQHLGAKHMSTFSFINQGTLENVYSYLFQSISSIFNQDYIRLAIDLINDPLGNDVLLKKDHLNPETFSNQNNNDKDNPLSPDHPLNIGNPANANSPLGLSNIDISKPTDNNSGLNLPPTNNPFTSSGADILNNAEDAGLFLKIYDNVIRIACDFYDPNQYTNYQSRHYSSLPPEYWSIYTNFNTAVSIASNGSDVYNHYLLIKEITDKINNEGVAAILKDPQFIISRVLYFLYLNPQIIIAALPGGATGLAVEKAIYLIYKYLIPFYITMRNMSWFIEKGINAFNFINNNAGIALDMYGKFLPKAYSKRSLATDFALKNYPESGELAVIYNAKGSNNQLVLGIDHEGHLVYQLKLGDTPLKEITSEDRLIPIGEKIRVGKIFNHGKVTLYLNGEKIGEGDVGTETISAYDDFTKSKNGARWGAPVDPEEDPYLVPIDAIFYDVAIDDEDGFLDEIITEELDASSKTASGTIVKTSNSKEIHNTNDTNHETDFSIFPNPAKTELNIIVEVQQAGQLSVNIFDLAGKQVYEMKESEISEGHQLITLRNLKLSAGQYIVKVKAGDVTQSEQVVFE